MASITRRFLVPVSKVSTRNTWHNNSRFVTQKWQNSQGVLPGKLGGGVQHASWNPYAISDQNQWFSLPYFRPAEALEPGMWTERVTGCYGTYTVVGINIKWEMVLSPNDEEVANSSLKKHTQFKTRVHKPYPISVQMVKTLIPYFRSKWLKNHIL